MEPTQIPHKFQPPVLSSLAAGWFDVATWYYQLQGYTESSIIHQWTELPKPHPLDPGGHWKPVSCTARQRVAIIIPFRNRDEHLQVFVRYMHSFLQRQLIDYTIFVIEQVTKILYTFNVFGFSIEVAGIF